MLRNDVRQDKKKKKETLSNGYPLRIRLKITSKQKLNFMNSEHPEYYLSVERTDIFILLISISSLDCSPNMSKD